MYDPAVGTALSRHKRLESESSVADQPALVMLIPLRLLWNLKVKKIEKLFVGFAMCVGAITMICAIIRASSLGSFADAGQIPISWLILWGLIEGIVGKLASTSTLPHQEHCSSKYYVT